MSVHFPPTYVRTAARPPTDPEEPESRSSARVTARAAPHSCGYISTFGRRDGWDGHDEIMLAVLEMGPSLPEERPIRNHEPGYHYFPDATGTVRIYEGTYMGSARFEVNWSRQTTRRDLTPAECLWGLARWANVYVTGSSNIVAEALVLLIGAMVLLYGVWQALWCVVGGWTCAYHGGALR